MGPNDSLHVAALCCARSTFHQQEIPMKLKTLTTLAAAVLATSAWAAGSQDSKCGAGTCGKKESSTKDATCSKKDGGCSKKDAACSKKDGGCSKKDGEKAH